jgi:hypothetical protein
MLRLDPLTAYVRCPRSAHAIGAMRQEPVVELGPEGRWGDATKARDRVAIIPLIRKRGRM